MFMHDKKKLPTIILSRMKGDKTENMEVKPEVNASQDADPLDMISHDLMQAFQDKSAMGVKEALMAFWNEVQLADREQDEEDMEG